MKTVGELYDVIIELDKAVNVLARAETLLKRAKQPANIRLKKLQVIAAQQCVDHWRDKRLDFK